MIPSHSASHGTVSEPALSELVVVAYGKRDDTHHVTWADAFTHIQHANSMLARAAPAYYTHTHALLTLGPGKLHLCRSLDGPLPSPLRAAHAAPSQLIDRLGRHLGMRPCACA